MGVSLGLVCVTLAFVWMTGYLLTMFGPENMARMIESHAYYDNSGEKMLFYKRGVFIVDYYTAVPNYTDVRIMNMLFYANVKGLERQLVGTETLKFDLQCRYTHNVSIVGYTLPLCQIGNEIPGRNDHRTHQDCIFHRSRMPVPYLTWPSICMVVVNHNHSDSVSDLVPIEFQWTTRIVPHWHWADWFPRWLTDEWYRAKTLACREGRTCPSINPDYWYGALPSDADKQDTYTTRTYRAKRAVDATARRVYQERVIGENNN